MNCRNRMEIKEYQTVIDQSQTLRGLKRGLQSVACIFIIRECGRPRNIYPFYQGTENSCLLIPADGKIIVLLTDLLKQSYERLEYQLNLNRLYLSLSHNYACVFCQGSLRIYEAAFHCLWALIVNCIFLSFTG